MSITPHIVRVGMTLPPSIAPYTSFHDSSINTERPSAAVLRTKDIHIDLAQSPRLFIIVPHATIVGRVTHWKPA